MNVEDRLYAVVRESVGITFQSYGELATHIHTQRPIEFLYNRLEQEYCMQAASIVPYVSLAHILDLLVPVGDDQLTSMVDDEPNEAGMRDIIGDAAIERLLQAGLTSEKLAACCRKMFKANFTVPNQRDVFISLGIDLTEQQFLQLTSIGKVREHFRYSLAYRRIMVPIPTLEE